MRCEHKSCEVTIKHEYCSLGVISDGEVVQHMSDGEPDVVGYDIWCADCHQFFAFTSKRHKHPKWLSKHLASFENDADGGWV